MYPRILVALDGSTTSKRTLKQAVRVAAMTHGRSLPVVAVAGLIKESKS